jgi:hypothetical protein
MFSYKNSVEMLSKIFISKTLELKSSEVLYTVKYLPPINLLIKWTCTNNKAAPILFIRVISAHSLPGVGSHSRLRPQ